LILPEGDAKLGASSEPSPSCATAFNDSLDTEVTLSVDGLNVMKLHVKKALAEVFY
jgi:hypothetical protein